RASSVKNRFRWQFGIVAPHAWSDEGGEPWQMRTECLIEPQQSTAVEITIRFLQVEEQEGPDGTPWETGVERKIQLGTLAIADLLGSPKIFPFEIPAEGGSITGSTVVTAERVEDLIKLRVAIENTTELPQGCDRTIAMRRSLAGAHTLLTVAGGAFLSLTDPPESARNAAQSCTNLHTWPVLVGAAGERSTVLSSPIILPDYPQVAPESPGDLYDATEIDEILTLRVMTLTDEEKREACATDQRAKAIIERSDSIPREMFERLHGAVREFQPANVEQFFNPAENDPERASVETAGGRVSKGAKVRLAPNRRADSMDLFLAGRIAIVQAIERDVEDRVYVGVRLEGDEAADLHERYIRSYYFYPDEIELMEAAK
ncbi:MAG: hypothetical protein JWP63_6926, partial [Candidatus Solibacter sp.]|nr:hypothetical protein [Candidatus Solibacter sp.]